MLRTTRIRLATAVDARHRERRARRMPISILAPAPCCCRCSAPRSPAASSTSTNCAGRSWPLFSRRPAASADTGEEQAADDQDSVSGADRSPRSFRDPDAFLVEHEGRLIRAVRPHAVANPSAACSTSPSSVAGWTRAGWSARLRIDVAGHSTASASSTSAFPLSVTRRMGAGDAGGRRRADAGALPARCCRWGCS